MKLRFTSVTTEQVGSSYKGITASYEARDSDGAGNISIDSGGLSAPQTGAPTYASLAVVEALTQTQIYNDFYDTTVIVIDSFNSEVIGEAWKADLQESLDDGIKIAQVDAGLVVIETADEIADQTPITI